MLGTGRGGTVDVWWHVPCTHSLTPGSSAKDSLEARGGHASPVLLDILCVGSTGVSHITGEGCYLKIKVYDCRPGISEVAFKFLLLEFSMASTASRCSVQMFR